MLKFLRRQLVGRFTGLVVSIMLAGSMVASAQPPRGSGEKLIALNFREAPLEQVLQFYGELTGRTMIKAPGVNAVITLRGQSRLTKKEALAALDSVLAMNNISLVPMGEKFLKVVQTATARQEGMETGLSIPGEDFTESDKLISQLITLKYLQISEAQPIVQSLLHGYGKILALERINTLMVTDTEGNVLRILELLSELDRPVETRVETRVYELRHAEASDIAARLNELIQQTEDQASTPSGTTSTRTPSRPGVIRARRKNRPQIQQQGQSEQDLAERGIIQGKVKIVADERTNILIVISEPANFAFFDRIVSLLDRPVEPEIIVRVVALEYADAEDIAGILNDFIGEAKSDKQTGISNTGANGEDNGRSRTLRDYVRDRARRRQTTTEQEKAKIGQLSDSTKILSDKRSNALLLMGRKVDIAVLMEIVDSLDVMLEQVLIEAVVLEVTLGNTVEQGVEWLQRSVTAYNENKIGPAGGLTVREPVMSFAGGQRFGSLPFQDASSLTDRSVPLASGLTYYTTFFDLNLDVIIRLAANSRDARILSTPVILTTDNTEASINVSEQRPVITRTSTTTGGSIQSSYEYRDIGLTLAVTPRINPSNFVVMEVKQTADELGGNVKIDDNEVPVILKREMEAQIAVKDRSTIVLGGLVSTDHSVTTVKVPLLGDIPILGWLFRSDSRKNNRTELLVLLTPYVLNTPDDVDRETRRLHNATSERHGDWPVGWSDSPLSPANTDEARLREEILAKDAIHQRYEGNILPEIKSHIDDFVEHPFDFVPMHRDEVEEDSTPPQKDELQANEIPDETDVGEEYFLSRDKEIVIHEESPPHLLEDPLFQDESPEILQDELSVPESYEPELKIDEVYSEPLITREIPADYSIPLETETESALPESDTYFVPINPASEEELKIWQDLQSVK